MRAVLLFGTGLFLFAQALQGALAAEVRVPDEPGALIAAVGQAEPGDVLRLGDVRYDGPILIDKALSLVGTGNSTVAGPGSGTVIAITSGDVLVQGIRVEGSGQRLNDLDSGIAIARSARNVRILDNRLEGNLIGIDVQGGQDVEIRGNRIVGRNDLRKSERGPGIYVWNAPGLLVEDNDIARGRDGVFITTSNHAVYRNNRFSELRFAFHSMYANDIEVTGNVSRGNDMGFAFMYSRKLRISGNLSEQDRTHGFFLNFANQAEIAGNEVRDGGEKCLFVYNSNKNRIADNRFAGCGIGIHFTAGSEGNVVSGNAFMGNRTQVKYVGTRWIEWSESGRGNYWSEQVAFDIDGDGIADSPYRPNDLVDQITWSQPMAKLLMGSPAVQLIRWSQSRFPGLLPGGVVDSHPLMSPVSAGLSASSSKGTTNDM
ncbi:nitrous oxidase accessory protein [Nitratireductor indicus]|nr:nitrous oxide reductase family maturation protein NosD [Nitratireductor indicus]MDS1136398.1 nitrous oxide reductase family maturation protein NosD [Nitratireductor indicus]SFQ75592.1 nitrous oxidase accessory protein [Nitratireductor indicus]